MLTYVELLGNVMFYMDLGKSQNLLRISGLE